MNTIIFYIAINQLSKYTTSTNAINILTTSPEQLPPRTRKKLIVIARDKQFKDSLNKAISQYKKGD
ncbi:MAG: hypothetical protein ACI4HO_02965 [Ruminococcus sp.]